MIFTKLGIKSRTTKLIADYCVLSRISELMESGKIGICISSSCSMDDISRQIYNKTLNNHDKLARFIALFHGLWRDFVFWRFS